MVYQKVKCPFCGSEDVSLFGKSKKGTQRYICNHDECSHKTFQLEYKYNACKPGVHERIIEMAMNGSGTRDTGRALRISKDTVTTVLKKRKNSLFRSIRNFLTNTRRLILKFTTRWPLKWTTCGLFAATRSMKYGSGGLWTTQRTLHWRSCSEHGNTSILRNSWCY